MRNSHPQPLDSEAENVEKIDAQTLRYERQKAARRLMPKERVAKCNWQKIAPYFELWKSKINKPGHFRKIFTCGSRAMCPVCAAKITERCKNELVAAFNVGHVYKIHVFMITFTIEHHKAEKFKKVASDLIESISILRGRRFWRNIESKYEIFGSVTSLETTYGLSNGFHPHKHVLFFSRLELTEDNYKKIQIEVTKEYKKILGKDKHTKGDLKGKLKFNRGLSKTNGVNVRGASQEVLEYVSKYGHEPRKIWGLATEVTKAEQKTGYKTGERYTPFQLLDENNLGDVDAGKAFQEYAAAMRGKAFLTWSNGLRDLFGLGVELTDEEIAALDNDVSSYPFAVGDGVAWNKVRKIPIETLEAMRSDFQTFKIFMESKGVNIESGMTEEGDKMILANIRHNFFQMLENKKREIKVAPDVLESMQNMDIEKLSETAKKMMKGKKRIKNISHDVFESLMSLDFITFRAAVKSLPKLRVISDQKILPDLTLKEILENIENHKVKIKVKKSKK